MENDNQTVYSLGARQGLWAGAYFSIIFLLQSVGSASFFSLLCGNLMVLAVPFVLYYLLRKRYKCRGCRASFSEVWMHGIMIFLCGSLILALVSLIFLRYIDPDFIYRETDRVIDLYRSVDNPTTAQFADILEAARKTNTLPSPMQCAMALLWFASFSGAVLSLIETPFVKLFTRPQA